MKHVPSPPSSIGPAPGLSYSDPRGVGMLTQARQASAYRSVAGSVHTMLVDLRFHDGRPSREYNGLGVQRVNTVLGMLQVGRQFSRSPDGSLDTFRSSPEHLSLAKELVDLVPAEMDEYRTRLNMRDWVERAVRVLELVRDSGKEWASLSADDLRFVEIELAPFLENVLALPPDDPEV